MLIKIRAKGKCQYPNCTRDGEQAHHIHPKSVCFRKYHWTNSKTNSLDNGCYLCDFHHKIMHENGNWGKYVNILKTINRNAS